MPLNVIKTFKIFAMKNIQHIGCLVLLALCFGELSAQESINASGGEASGTGGSSSYSVGQTFYTHHTSGKGSFLSGVQQAYEIMILTGIDVKAISLELSVYPNPTADVLNLQVSSSFSDALSYQLYDMQGNILFSNSITDSTTPISLHAFASSTYFLKVFNSKGEIKSFKILKT